MKKFITVAVLITGLASFSGLSLAQPEMGRGGPPGIENLDHLDMLADQIGLTEEQGTEITEIVNNAQLASAVDRERIHQIKDELRAMADNFDASQAQILADELGEISGRLAYNGTESHAAIRQVFTEEQRVMLEELRAEHESSRSRFGGGKRRPSGGGGRGYPPVEFED
jgi:Spy/CpxP family protein refolding chaperone